MIDAATLKEMDLWDARFRMAHHVWPPDFPAVVEAWLELYLNGSAEYRDTLRTAIGARDHERLANAIDCYASEARKRLAGEDGARYLRLGVAAVSLANCPSDYRDTWFALANLVVDAERLGLDPVPTLKEIAIISSDTVSRGGFIPMNQVLAEFHTYAVVEETRKKSISKR